MANIIHQVQDDDMVFTLDTVTRKLVNSGSKKKTIPQYSHNSERLTFEVPRYIEGHDMSECNAIQIHYNNIEVKTKNESKDVYECTDMEIGDDKITFSWLLSKKATTYEGSLNFIVILKCVTDGELHYAYPTEIYDKIRVTKGIDNGEAVAEEYSDILASWRAEIMAELIGDISTEVEKHNNSDNAHQDIRGLLEGLADAVSAFTITVLWENANPSSAFAAQSIPGINVDDYDAIYITAAKVTTEGMSVGENSIGMLYYPALEQNRTSKLRTLDIYTESGNGLVTRFSTRGVIFSSNVIDFNVGRYVYGKLKTGESGGLQNNFHAVPLKIYGIKGA